MNIATWADKPVMSRRAVRRLVLAMVATGTPVVVIFVAKPTGTPWSVLWFILYVVAAIFVFYGYIHLWLDGYIRVCRWLRPRPWSEGRKFLLAWLAFAIPGLAWLWIPVLVAVIDRLWPS